VIVKPPTHASYISLLMDIGFFSPTFFLMDSTCHSWFLTQFKILISQVELFKAKVNKIFTLTKEILSEWFNFVQRSSASIWWTKKNKLIPWFITKWFKAMVPIFCLFFIVLLFFFLFTFIFFCFWPLWFSSLAYPYILTRLLVVDVSFCICNDQEIRWIGKGKWDNQGNNHPRFWGRNKS
jgi:hypothetical protein